MKSTSFTVSTIQELEFQIRETQRHDFSPTLGIVFGSINCDLNDIPNLFNLYNIDVVGCSTSGEICDDRIAEMSMTVMLMDLRKDSYAITVSKCEQRECEMVGDEIGHFGKSFCDRPAFLIFMDMTANAENIIKGISNVISEKAKIFGGIAGGDFKMEKTFVFTNEGCESEAVATLAFDQDKVSIKGLALCGWQSIGVENEVTHAEENIVYTINDRPAVEVFESYFGSFNENEIDSDVMVGVGAAQYPFQIIRGNNAVLRSPLKVLEDQSILMAGPVHTGDKFKFSVAPGFEIIEETVEGYRKYQTQNPDADALILISCKARHMSLGPLIEDEIAGIQNIWKKPLIGFFSYGEVGLNETGDALLYNETCSLVLISEKR